jgi:hypothetical protein
MRLLHPVAGKHLRLSLLLPLAVTCVSSATPAARDVQPGNWTAGPWIWTTARVPQSLHEVIFTPFTETYTDHYWQRRGPRRLARHVSVSGTRPTGDFQFVSAEGVPLTLAGIYRQQDGQRYAREDSRPKDYYTGLVLEWRGQGFSVAGTDLKPLKPYVGSTLTPLRDEAPLFAALRRGDRAWIATQPDLVTRVMTERDALGRTLLYRAAQLDDRETLALLLAKGVPADLQNSSPLQRTALAAAIRLSRLDVVDQLLAAGADPNFPDARGSRPLHIAGEGCGSYRKVVRRLLAAGADPALPNKAGETPRQRLEKAHATGFLPILIQEISASEKR